MVGRIEGMLKDLYGKIDLVVDNWLNCNYIETLSRYPKEVFRQQLIDNCKRILDRSQPHEFGTHVHEYLSGWRFADCNKRSNYATYIELAQEVDKEITATRHTQQRPIHREDEVLVNSIALGYGLKLFGNEAANIVQLFMREERELSDDKLRNYIIATYIANNDVPEMNMLMTQASGLFVSVSPATVRKDINRILKGAIPFNPDADDIRERLTTLETMDSICTELGRLAAANNVEIPDVRNEAAYDILTNLDTIQEGIGSFDENVWNYYYNKYIKPTQSEESNMTVASVNPMAYLPRYDIIAMVIRHLNDSAIGYSELELEQFVDRMVEGGIYSPRSVEMAVQARWATNLSPLQRTARWVEAIVRDLPLNPDSEVREVANRYKDRELEAVTMISQYQFPLSIMFSYTQQMVVHLIIRSELTKEIGKAIDEVNYRLIPTTRINVMERELIVERLLARWDNLKNPPAITADNMIIWLNSGLLDRKMYWITEPVATVKESISKAAGVVPVKESISKPVTTVVAQAMNEVYYRFMRDDVEYVITREYGVHPTSEMPLMGAWVMREYHTGDFIDSDRFRAALTARNNIAS